MKSMTKRLLSARIQHSMKERGVDLTQIWREEPKGIKHELTPVEKLKLEKKRQKNRVHAKQSRERRNFNFAKTEKENKVLKKEINILRNLLVVYYEKLTGQDLVWSEVEVKSPPLSSCIQSVDKPVDRGVFIKLPQDVTRMLQTAGKPEPYSIEEILTYVQSMMAFGLRGPVTEEDGSISLSDESINIQQHVRHVSKLGAHSPTYLVPNELSFKRPVPRLNSDTYRKSSDLGCRPRVDMKCTSSAENPFTSLAQGDTSLSHTKTSNLRWRGRVAPAHNVEQKDTDKRFLLNFENDSKSQSPWMVNSKLEEISLELRFNKSTEGNESVRIAESNEHKQEPFVGYSQQAMKQDVADDYLNSKPVKPMKVTVMVRPMTENSDTFKGEINCPSSTFDSNFQDSELAVNWRTLQEKKGNGFQNMGRSRSYPMGSPHVKKRTIETMDILTDNAANELSDDSLLELDQDLLSELEEILRYSSQDMTIAESAPREVFTSITTDEDDTLALGVQSGRDCAQNNRQDDPVDIFSSLNLYGMVVEEADALGSSFSLGL